MSERVDKDEKATSAGGRSFLLGDWLILPELNQLRSQVDGAVVENHLHPKAMEVLTYLADQSGQVVSKEILLEKIWPGTFVSEQVLSNAIWEVRRALGDTAKDQRMIQTVPKRGYRLLMPVIAVAWPETAAQLPAESARTDDERPDDQRRDDEGLMSEPATPEAPLVVASSGSVSRRWWIRTAVFALGAILIFGFWTWNRRVAALKVEAEFAEAQKAVAALRNEDALELLQEMLEKNPKHAGAHELLANVYDQIGQKDLALATIERALELARANNGPEVERLAYERMRARIRGDIEAERLLLQKLLALRPTSARWHSILAWFRLTNDRECVDAQERYQRAIEIDPQVQFFFYRAEAAMACGNREVALASARRAIELSPDEPGLHSFLSYLYYLTGDHRASEQELERALALDPKHVDALLNRARLLIARNRSLEAIEQLRRLRGLTLRQNTPADSYLIEALAELELGHPEIARESVEAALRLSSESLEALHLDGLIALVMNDGARAESRRQELATLLGKTTSLYQSELLHHLEGRLALFRGDEPGAIKAFNEALRRRPVDQTRFRLDLAWAYEANQELEEAVGALYALLDINPNEIEARCRIGRIHWAAGRPEVARAELEACSRLLEDLGSLPPDVEDPRPLLAKLSGSLEKNH
jgi:DNA-binding winged helix-turn-helix (wHTH) protein/tetratricopeptide (TPR) repeat protein